MQGVVVVNGSRDIPSAMPLRQTRPAATVSGAFVDEATSILLDLARGAAALVVMIAHALQLGFYATDHVFSGEIQHDAVLLFFVLSGIVIRASVDRPGMTLRRYVARRARRILPVSIAAVFFSTAVYLFCMRWTGTGSYDQFSLAGFILPLLFLSEHFGGIGLVYDPAYWSLCYEVAYYALFGAVWFLRGGRRIAVLALLLVFAGPPALAMMPSWLFGVALAGLPAARRTTPRQGALLVALAVLGVAACTVVGLATRIQMLLTGWGVPLYDLRFAQHAGSDVVIGLFMAIGFAGLRGVAPAIPSLLKRAAPFARWFAGLSFSLYLFHWPLFKLLLALGVGAGQGLAGFSLLLLAMIMASAIIARLLEQPTLLRARWGRWSAGAAGVLPFRFGARAEIRSASS